MSGNKQELSNVQKIINNTKDQSFQNTNLTHRRSNFNKTLIFCLESRIHFINRYSYKAKTSKQKISCKQ